MRKTTAIVGLLLLGTGIVLVIISVRKAKIIVRYLKQKHPEGWKNAGKSAPGYFQSL